MSLYFIILLYYFVHPNSRFQFPMSWIKCNLWKKTVLPAFNSRMMVGSVAVSALCLNSTSDSGLVSLSMYRRSRRQRGIRIHEFFGSAKVPSHGGTGNSRSRGTGVEAVSLYY